MKTEITIRSLTTLSQIEPIEELQKDVWGYGASLDAPFPYPARCLFEFAESGGLIAAAFEGESYMIGFAAAWVGIDKTSHQLYLHSQLVGIRESFRDRNIGYRLKLHQKEFAAESDIPSIRWTFDPLQTRNAYLNLHKLGAVVRVFVPDYYGGLGGKMNRGLATDRFWAEWSVNPTKQGEADISPSVISDIAKLRVINEVQDANERSLITKINLDLDDDLLLIELPENMQQLRQTDPDVVADWQRQLRKVFMHYLPRYTIVDYIRQDGKGFYLLTA